MEKLSTVVYGVISLVVVVILIMTIALPVIEDSQHIYTTKEQNTGTRYMAAYSTGTEVEISSYDTTTHSFTINDETLTSLVTDDPTDIPTDRVYILWDNGFFYTQYDSDNGYWTAPVAYFVDDTNTFTAVNMVSNSLTFSNGVVTSTGTSEVSNVYTYLIIPALDGDLAVYDAAEDLPKYIDSDSRMYSMVGFSWASMMISSGTVSNQIVSKAVRSYEVVDDVTVTTTYEPTAYGVSNKLTAVTATNFNTSLGIYEIFIPIEYTVVEDNSGPIYLLLGVIPLVLAIIPIMLAVQLITGNRRD